MKRTIKVLNKVEHVNCGKVTCRDKTGPCKFLGRWLFVKGVESSYCCELLKLGGIMPLSLDCHGKRVYRACSLFEIGKA